MDIIYSHYAYLFFHVVIITSIGLSKICYKPMVLPSLKKLLKSVPVIIFFLIWDGLVTTHWWDFNQSFVLHQYTFFKLPIEEILFFITVPFALLTLTENLHQRIKEPKIEEKKSLVYMYYSIKGVLIVVTGITLFQGYYYTSFITGALFFAIRRTIIFNKIYSIGIGLTALTTLLFNYYLTALPIVTYNQVYKTNAMIGTIPLEDFGYGILLYIAVVLIVYEKK
jgi:lycopene cyclase domain-containing protein